MIATEDVVLAKERARCLNGYLARSGSTHREPGGVAHGMW
jgi:hypothetical protein